MNKQNNKPVDKIIEIDDIQLILQKIKNNHNGKGKSNHKGRKSLSKKFIFCLFSIIIFLTVLLFISIYVLNEIHIQNIKNKQLLLGIDNSSQITNTNTLLTTEISKQEGLRQNNDILSTIRLVLFDYEIDSDSITENIDKNNDIFNIRFQISADKITSNKVNITLGKILKSRNYIVSHSNSLLIAYNRDSNIEIVFSNIDVDDTKYLPAADLIAVDKKRTTPPIPPTASATVVNMSILLDDAGHNYELVERFVEFPYPIAVAVLPYLQYSKEIAYLLSSYNKTIFFHFPMEPNSYPLTDPGEGAVLLNMSEELIQESTRKALESLGMKVDGVNNHMGSAFTADRTKMRQVLPVIKEYTDVFIDSRTSPNSVAYSECVALGMRCAKNQKFIDNNNDINMILSMIYEAAEIAKIDGEVLVIGHMRAKTLDALKIALPILEERNISIIPISQIVK